MSKIILNAYGSRIEAAVSDKVKVRKLITYIERYIDKNNAVIFSQGPSDKLLFANYDKDAIFDFVGVTAQDIKDLPKLLKSVTTIKANWKLLNDPFIVITTYIVREMVKQKNPEWEKILMFLSLKVYSGLFNKYYKHGVNEQIMSYTLNNLSEKFKHKALKNNYAVVKEVVLNSHLRYTSILLAGDDDMLNTYFSQIYNRLNKIMRNIANNYYDNRDKKRYLNTIRSYSEEDGALLDYDNSDALIGSLADGTTTYFISSTINMPLAKTVADRNNVPFSTVFQTLTAIKKEEKASSILEFCSALVSMIYDADSGLIGRVCSKDFAITAIKQLSISNTRNPSLTKVKDMLDHFLNEYCAKYAMTNRLATKMAYRNAIYSYFVYILIINRCR